MDLAWERRSIMLHSDGVGAVRIRRQEKIWAVEISGI